LFFAFWFLSLAIGFFSILAQFVVIPNLLAPMILKGEGFISSESGFSDFNAVTTTISVSTGILMTVASRILPGLVILIGEGFPTVSNRDNVTNNYMRLLLVLWTVYCVRIFSPLFHAHNVTQSRFYPS
jgi:hypothetical protein